MKNQQLFYQESGKFNLIRNSVSYTLAIVLGYFYAFFVGVIPIIYLNFLLTLGFGIVIAFMCIILSRFSHNRSKKSRIIFVSTIALVACYSQFTAFIIRIYIPDEITLYNYFLNLGWILYPKDFFELIIEVNSFGAWGVFGVVFTGFGLAEVWVIEILRLIIVPVAFVYNKQAKPYSEFNTKWYPRYVLFNDFESVVAVNILMNKLSESPVDAIKNLEKGTGLRYSKIHLFFMKEEEKQYITIENYFFEGENNKKKSDIVINNFMISRASADLIMKEFEAKKEKFEFF